MHSHSQGHSPCVLGYLKMASSAVRRSAQILAKNSALFLCDMQSRFEPSVQHFNEIVAVSNRILKVAMAFEIPTIVTEQYPKGLGPTTPALGIEEYGLKPIAKTTFSMLVPEVEKMLQSKPNVKSIILCGIETHACVQATALHLLDKNYDVYVVMDASSSRNPADRKIAFDLMRDCGAFLTTSESLCLNLLKDTGLPKFKEIKHLLISTTPGSGL